ncbi:MAG: hypothetical protein K8L97_09710, partial [Anaerolineae bacterium]|nr:hypothetical protein [Anaerolineae bacterium]
MKTLIPRGLLIALTVILIALPLSLIQAAAVVETVNGALNTNNEFTGNAVGFLYPAANTFPMGRIESKWVTAGMNITLWVYDEPPSLGGTLLANGNFVTVGGNVWEGGYLNNVVNMVAGEDYFIGFSMSAPTNVGGGGAAYPTYYSLGNTTFATDCAALCATVAPVMRLLSVPTFSINDVTVTEGNAGTVNAVFTVTRAGDTTTAVDVNFTTANNTATIADNDYVANAGTLNFGVGVLTQTVTVVVNGDLNLEADETFFVNLNTPTGDAVIVDAQGIGTITTDDAAPDVTIDDVTVVEGDAGTVNAVFTVTRTGGAGAFSVNFTTANNSATAGVDYVANAGTLNFGAGVNTQNITVVVNGDFAIEGDETFFVNLNAPTNGAVISDAQGIGTITDDDAAPDVTIDDVTVTEGNAGTVNAVFTVTRTGGGGPFSVNFATANNTATAGVDYVANAGTLNFGAGVNTQTITVVVNGDVAFEGNETYFVNLNTPTNGATISDNQGLGSITDDDGPPTFTINDVTVTEGNAGTVNAVFTVTRVGDLSGANSVDWATADGTATIADNDYAAGGATLNFAATIATQTVTVVVNGDVAFEGDETFFVNLANATGGATITDAQGIGTITNDDAPPGISVNDVTVSEAAAAGQFTVTLNPAQGVAVTVDYTITDGTAANGTDFNAVAAGTLTFNIGVTTQPIPFNPIDNPVVDGNRTFTVTLNNSSGPVIADATGIGTITDNDGIPPPPTTTTVDAPPPPPVPLCADLNGSTNTIVRAQIPAGVFGVHCGIIAENRVFIRTAAEVGVQSVLDQGVIHAVDVFSPSNVNAAGSLICLQGTGGIMFLNANGIPRVAQWLPTSVVNGYTCATIPAVGTVVLVGTPPP